MSHLAPEQIEAVASGGSDPHLESCADCRKSVASARARRSLLKGMKDITLTDVAFRRIEAKVMSDIEAPVSAWGLVRAQLRNNWVLVAVAAGLVLVVSVPRWLESKVPVVTPVAVKAPVKQAPVAHTEQLLAVLVEGQVLRNGSALAAGDVVKSGDAIDARRGRVVLNEAGHDSRFELMGQAHFGGPATVALEEGVLAVDSPAEVLIDAGAWVSGTDCAFVVSRAAAEVVVDVLRGQLLVSSESSLREGTKLSALAQLKVALPARGPFAVGGLEPAPYPFTSLPRQPWAKFEIGDLPAGTNFDIDGQRIGGTPASLLLGLGKHKVRTHIPGQPSRESFVELIAGGDTHFKVPPRTGPEKEEPPPSDDAIAELQRALKEQRPKLRACYEKWLKANPSATGQVELTLVVARNGKVTAARVEDATIPRESIDCLVRTGKTLRLPALGSEQEIQVPLVLTPGSSH